MGSRLRSLALRLALIAYLVTALVPARGFVLCLEPDGGIALELVRAGDECEPCADEPAPDAAPERCACIDIPVPSQRDDGAGEATPVRVVSAAATPPRAPLLAARIAIPPARLAPFARAPRPAPGLAGVRTTVLRV